MLGQPTLTGNGGIMEALVKVKVNEFDTDMLDIMDADKNILWCVAHIDLLYTHGDPWFDKLREGISQ